MEELIRAHLANVGNPTNPDIYADDVVAVFPYAPKHHTGRLEGKARVLGFLEAIGKYFSDILMGEPVIHLTSDPNVAVVEVPGNSVSKETGLPYSQNYVTFVTVRDGKIVGLKEYYDPIQVLVATGEIAPVGE